MCVLRAAASVCVYVCVCVAPVLRRTVFQQQGRVCVYSSSPRREIYLREWRNTAGEETGAKELYE